MIALSPPKQRQWTVTHTAWLALCPVYLAEIASQTPVPIPRFRWLATWLDFNFWLYDRFLDLCETLHLTDPDDTGYFFNCVKPIPPRIITTTDH